MMNKKMNLPQMQKIMMEFDQQNEMLGLKEDELRQRLRHLGHRLKETMIYLTTLSFSLLAIFR